MVVSRLRAAVVVSPAQYTLVKTFTQSRSVCLLAGFSWNDVSPLNREKAPFRTKWEHPGPGAAALGRHPVQQAAARASTASSMGSVSFPVNVFCWLGW